MSRSTCIPLYPATDGRQTGNNFVADTRNMSTATSGYKCRTRSTASQALDLLVSWLRILKTYLKTLSLQDRVYVDCLMDFLVRYCPIFQCLVMHFQCPPIGVIYERYRYPYFLDWGVPYPTFQDEMVKNLKNRRLAEITLYNKTVFGRGSHPDGRAHDALQTPGGILPPHFPLVLGSKGASFSF